jgi:hypothetical protein
MTYDVAWGYDVGEDVAHVTTNVSPGPPSVDDLEFPVELDFFRANEIVKVEDADTGAVLFDLTHE